MNGDLLGYFNRVVFNHGVGQKLFAHVFDTGVGFGGLSFSEIKLDVFALADILNPVEAEGAESVLYGFALWIQDAVFQSNMDFGFHALVPFRGAIECGPLDERDLNLI
jgi:hypothetical protein